jgi:hypothetical protein
MFTRHQVSVLRRLTASTEAVERDAQKLSGAWVFRGARSQQAA